MRLGMLEITEQDDTYGLVLKILHKPTDKVSGAEYKSKIQSKISRSISDIADSETNGDNLNFVINEFDGFLLLQAYGNEQYIWQVGKPILAYEDLLCSPLALKFIEFGHLNGRVETAERGKYIGFRNEYLALEKLKQEAICDHDFVNWALILDKMDKLRIGYANGNGLFN